MRKIVYFLLLNTLLVAGGFGIPVYQTNTAQQQEIQNLKIQEQRSLEALQRQNLLEQLINKQRSLRVEHGKTQANITKIENALQSIDPQDTTSKEKLEKLLKETQELAVKQKAAIDEIDIDIRKLQTRSF